ncbi:MAG TPA: ExeM/NucH family extracellular endonuclease [Gaiellaceae bacterium]|nr:ExeM/NucH family extracellular endonuclease [Gaiellaceae bacterium]
MNLRRAVAGVLACAIGLVIAGGSVASTSTPAHLVISQVYGAGGNSGAVLTHDYVELFNPTSAPISLNGLSLQYTSATGTGNFGASSTQLTELSGSVAPGRYYLVQQAGGANGAPLPAPDHVDPSPIAMAAAAGKIALVTGTTALGCNGGSTPCSAEQLARIVDLVGYGTGSSGANFFEGSGPAPTLSTTTAAFRADGGCTDANDNRNDFTAASPAPRNSASPLHSCTPTVALSVNDVSAAEGNSGTTAFTFTVSLSQPAAAGGVTFDVATADGTAAAPADYASRSLTGQTIPAGSSSYSFTVTVNGDTAYEPDETFFVDVANVTGATVADGRGVGTILNDDVDCTAPYTPIPAIQGSGTTAATTGNVTTQGVVVGDFEGATGLQGFYLQDPVGDGDPATSDGIFVFTGAADRVSEGQVVRVTGYARERFSQTTINGSNSNTSAVTSIDDCGTATSVLPTEVSLPFETTEFPERYEGMLVRLPQSLVISEYFDYDRFGEFVLALPLAGESRPFTPTSIDEPGGPALARLQANVLRRILVDDGLGIQNPAVLRHPNGQPFALDNRFRGGDRVTDTVGVLGFEFNRYRIQPTAPAAHTAVNARPAAPASVGGDVRVAAFNTLNFFITGDYRTGDPLDNKCGPARNMECRGHDADQANEFPRQRAKLLAALVGLDADVVGLNELENTEGVDPLEHPDGIVPGLNDQLGAGTYASIETETIGTDAIKVGLIYKPAKVRPVGSFALLTSEVDPRFIDTRSRPALAQTFEEVATGARFTVVVNHLKSKGSACAGDPDTGDGQGNCNLTRKAAAEALVDWVATDPTGSGDADFLIIGDLNSYAQEDPIDAVRAGADDTPGTGDDYTNLISRFMGKYAYSYGFDGMFGYLDHALSNATMTPQVTGATEWHINADEPDVLDYDTSFKPDAQDALYEPNAFRSSDHDPVLVGLRLSATYADLRRVTREWVTNSGVAESLVAKLNAAEAAAARGNVTAKNGALGAYRNELEAQSGKTITAERARTLIRLSSAL